VVEAGLIAIKTLNLLGTLLSYFFRLLARSFRWLFKSALYRILAKIYYTIFRLKKTGVIKKSPAELLHTKYLYLFIILLSVILIFSNLTNNSQANALENKISKTILANLLPTEFGGVTNEELIEETITPNSLLTAGKEKYLVDSCSLEKQTDLAIDDNLDNADELLFNDDGDVVFKPYLTTGATGASETPSAARTEIVYYTVQNGDTISTIAQHFGISVNTVLWANNLSSFGLIRPGDRLTILPYSGVLYTVKRGDTLAQISKKYGLEIEKILSCNNLGNSLSVGQKIILPGAKKISETTIARTNTGRTSGLTVIKNLIKSPAAAASGNKMTWPTQGHRITQYFSWRHPGVDIANKSGTPIYAADAGVVEFAGWATGYGNSIVINHGGGKKTRYGHASKLFVKVGDEVEKGENIMAMGSTGWSTGPHLHFEVIINGGKYNPLNYIK